MKINTYAKINLNLKISKNSLEVFKKTNRAINTQEWLFECAFCFQLAPIL